MPGTSTTRWLAWGVTVLPPALLAIILVTGCAPTPSQPSGDRAGTADAPREINVIMRDYLFEPDPIVLHGGETVRFNVINAGLLAHEFVLGDPAVQAAWATAEAAATPPGFTATPPPVSLPPDVGGLRIFLGSGASSSVVYEVPRGKGLELACQIPGHIDQGMVGTITILDDGP
jgi:uncharacterized cupredoxin-like copper-binding protein